MGKWHCQSYHGKLWLVWFWPVKPKLWTHCQAARGLVLTVSSHLVIPADNLNQDVCSFQALLPLSDRDSFCWQRQFFHWKCVHYVVGSLFSCQWFIAALLTNSHLALISCVFRLCKLLQRVLVGKISPAICDIMAHVKDLMFTFQERSWSTFWLSYAIWSVATGNQQNGPMKSFQDCHWSTPPFSTATEWITWSSQKRIGAFRKGPVDGGEETHKYPMSKQWWLFPSRQNNCIDWGVGVQRCLTWFHVFPPLPSDSHL